MHKVLNKNIFDTFKYNQLYTRCMLSNDLIKHIKKDKNYKDKKVELDKVIENSYLQVKHTIQNLESNNIDFNFGFIYADPFVKKFETHDRFIPIIFNEFVKHGSHQGEDGHHPSEQGHKLFAEEITKYIS